MCVTHSDICMCDPFIIESDRTKKDAGFEHASTARVRFPHEFVSFDNLSIRIINDYARNRTSVRCWLSQKTVYVRVWDFSTTVTSVYVRVSLLDTFTSLGDV